MRRRLALAVLLVVAVIAVYQLYISTIGRRGEEALVIYTYESLLRWGKDPDAVWDKVFYEFGRRHGCNVTVIVFSDAGTMLKALIEERGDPRADVVIGLDNVLIFQAKKWSVLEPYTPPNIGDIRPELVESLDPEHYVVPYDYGLIAFVYDSERVDPEVMESPTFEDFYSPEMASLLVIEDPTTSSTGTAFLLWQIAYYEKVLRRDWREWWREVAGHAKVVPSWGEAYDIFLKEETGRPIVVSYGTDPAYSLYFYESTRYRAALVYRGGKAYAWLQIEGIGLVKGAKHPELAKKFIEWFLSPEVQELIPLNQWMYPASTKVKLPEVYKAAIDPYSVELLNTYLTPEEVSQNLERWLEEWREAVSG